jgi:hypothetical protein
VLLDIFIRVLLFFIIGVPGFYTPNYGSSYGESTTAMHNHHTATCDDAYMPAENPASRPQPSTPRRALGALPSASNSEYANVPRRPLPTTTPTRKRTALEPVTSEPTSDVMVTPNKQSRFTMESNSEKETNKVFS